MSKSSGGKDICKPFGGTVAVGAKGKGGKSKGGKKGGKGY